MLLGERKSSLYMHYTLTRPYSFIWCKTAMLYPGSRGFSLARLLAIIKSFASLVIHVVGFLWRRKQINYATEELCKC